MGDQEGQVALTHKDLNSYFNSNTLEVLSDKVVTQQFKRFLASKCFQDMLHSTTKTIILQVVCNSVEAVVAKEIDKAIVQLLLNLGITL